jgi:hypothetical protein
MAFELNIAVKRCPLEQRGGEAGQQAARRPVTIVEASGELSPASALDLTQRLDDVVDSAPSSVILRFVGDVPVPPDRGFIEVVGAWLKRRRRDGASLYVEVRDAHAREVFERVEDMRAAMLPFGVDPDVPRRMVDDPSSAVDNGSV